MKISKAMILLVLVLGFGCDGGNGDMERRELELERRELELEKKAFELEKEATQKNEAAQKSEPIEKPKAINKTEPVKKTEPTEKPEAPKIKYSEPQSVIEEILKCAKNGDLSELKYLCNSGASGKAFCICDLENLDGYNGEPMEVDYSYCYGRSDFRTIFSRVEIDYDSIENDGKTALVPVYGVKRGHKQYAYFALKKEGKRWYLVSFE